MDRVPVEHSVQTCKEEKSPNLDHTSLLHGKSAPQPQIAASSGLGSAAPSKELGPNAQKMAADFAEMFSKEESTQRLEPDEITRVARSHEMWEV